MGHASQSAEFKRLADHLPRTTDGVLIVLNMSVWGGSTYTHIAPFHLERYCDEEAFRYNNRKVGDGERFWLVLSRTVGRRVTYRQLCMINDCGFMGIT